MSLEGGSGHGGDGGNPSPGGGGPSGEGVGGISPGSGGGLEGGTDKGGVDGNGGAEGTDGADGAGGFDGGFDGGDSMPGAGGESGGFEGGADFGGGPGGGELGDADGFGAMDATPFTASQLDAVEQNDGEVTDQSDESTDLNTEQTAGQATAFTGTELGRADGGRMEQTGPVAVAETRSSATAFKTEVGTPTKTETEPSARPAEVNPGKPNEMPAGQPTEFGTARPAEVSPAAPTEVGPTDAGTEQNPTGPLEQPGQNEQTEQTGQTGTKADETAPGKQDGVPAARPAEVNPTKTNEVGPAKSAEVNPAKSDEAKNEPQVLQPEGQPDRQPQEITPGPVDPAQPMMSEKTGETKPEPNGGTKPEGDKPSDKPGDKPDESGKPGEGGDAGEDADPPETRKDAVDRHIEAARKERTETITEAYKDDPEKRAKLQELVERNDKLTRPYYDESVEVAKHAEAIENYSDHNKAHIDEVTTAVVKNAEQIHKKEEADGLPPEARVKDEVLISAAQWHDVGMAGTKEDRKAIEDDPDAKLDGNKIRSQHANESALTILEHQDDFETPDMAFETALVTHLHTKNNSGVPSLGEKQAMIDAANRLKNDYEKRNEGKPSFDLSKFGKVNEEGELVDLDPDAQTRITNEALALRVADGQRPASDTPTTMTGRVMESEKTRYTDTTGFGRDVADEVAGQKIEYIDPDDPEAPVTESENATALMYLNGERNVDAGTMHYTGDGKLEISYVVRDAYVDQAATVEVLDGRMKEADSAPAAKDAPPGSVSREQIVHVVQIEKGDEKARAALEEVLNKSYSSYTLKNGEEVDRTIRVELKK